MPKGIGAVMVIAALILSLTILTGTGWVAGLGGDLEVDATTANADVQRAADQLTGVEFGEGRSAAILQGPLAAVTPVVRIFQTFTAVLFNTSGVIQLLYGVGPTVGDSVELFGRLAFLVTLGYLIRSGSPV